MDKVRNILCFFVALVFMLLCYSSRAENNYGFIYTKDRQKKEAEDLMKELVSKANKDKDAKASEALDRMKAAAEEIEAPTPVEPAPEPEALPVEPVAEEAPGSKVAEPEQEEAIEAPVPVEPAPEPEALPVEPAAEEAPKAETKEIPEILVDLDLKDVDLKDVARALSKISGKNIIVVEDAKTKVTLRVKDMTWREVLNMVLDTYGLTMVEKDNYIMVTTFEKRRASEENGDLETRVVRFNFADVVAIQKTLLSMLSRRGKIETEPRVNGLVITDIPEVIDRLEKVALALDTKTPQVLIDAMMITVKLNNDSSMGVTWDITHKDVSSRELKQSLALTGTAGTDYFWQFKYGKTLTPWADLSATINFLVEQKKAVILANPKVLTLDNMAANIELTEQVPYTQQTTSTESSSSVSSVQFKDIPVTLAVKPHITKDNYIMMNVRTEESFRTGFVTGTTQPIIDTRKAETNVMVRDGETIVIGGLRKKEDSITTDKVPILGDIPFLGRLFRRDVKSKVDTELMIFITPHITVDSKLNVQDQQYIQKIMERETPQADSPIGRFYNK